MKRLPEQHNFDFKVNVNYNTGNVTIKGPNGYSPPLINSQQPPSKFQFSKISQTTNSSVFSPQQNYAKFFSPQKIVMQEPPKLNYCINSAQNSNKDKNSNTYCVICQRDYTADQFEAHLELHKRKKNQAQIPKKHNTEKTEQINFKNSHPLIRYNTVSENQHSVYPEQYSFQKISSSQHQSPVTSKNSSFSHPHKNSFQFKNERPQLYYPNERHSYQGITNNFLEKSVNQSVALEQPNEQFPAKNISHYFQSEQNSRVSHHSLQKQVEISHHNGSNVFANQSMDQSSSKHPKNIPKGIQASQSQSSINPFNSLGSFPQNQQNSRSQGNSSGVFSYQYQKQPNYHTRFRSSERNFEDQILEVTAFKKNKNEEGKERKQFYRDQIQSESSLGDVKETLENMGRQQMIMMTQSIQKSSIYAPNKPKITQKSVIYPQNYSNVNKGYASYEQETNKFQEQSLLENKPLSFHLSEMKLKEIHSSKIFRGVQANAEQIQQEAKSNQSMVSKATKSTKTKIPKNALAVFEHLSSSEIQINTSARGSLKSFKSLK